MQRRSPSAPRTRSVQLPTRTLVRVPRVQGARQARQLSAYPVGDLACFNVDFSREFRYCLETGVDPTPASELSTLRLSVPVTETSNDIYGELSVAGDGQLPIDVVARFGHRDAEPERR